MEPIELEPTDADLEHDWHADWEFGECDYLDEAGFPQRKHTWHRHPFGTEYAELYT